MSEISVNCQRIGFIFTEKLEECLKTCFATIMSDINLDELANCKAIKISVTLFNYLKHYKIIDYDFKRREMLFCHKVFPVEIIESNYDIFYFYKRFYILGIKEYQNAQSDSRNSLFNFEKLYSNSEESDKEWKQIIDNLKREKKYFKRL